MCITVFRSVNSSLAGDKFTFPGKTELKVPGISEEMNPVKTESQNSGISEEQISEKSSILVPGFSETKNLLITAYQPQ